MHRTFRSYCEAFLLSVVLFCENVAPLTRVSDNSVIHNASPHVPFIGKNVIHFKCQSGSDFPPGSTISWFIRDPITKLKTFYSDDIRDETPKYDPRTINSFHLKLRTDFSHQDLVCRLSNGFEVLYRLPQISPLYPVTVSFLSRNLVLGEKLRLRCIVAGDLSKNKQVWIREPEGMIPARPTGQKPYPYYFEAPPAGRVTMDFDGTRIQCLAIWPNGLSVASKLTTFIVHYLKFLSITSCNTTVRGRNCALKILFSAHPPPKKEHLIIEMTAGNVRLLIQPSEISISNSQMTMSFLPPKSGYYKLRYQSSIFRNVSRPFEVNVQYVEFRRLSLCGKSGSIFRRQNCSFVWTYLANPKPKKEYFTIELTHGNDRSKPIVPFVSINNSRLVMSFIPPRTGTYKVLYRSPSVRNASRSFQIKVFNNKRVYYHRKLQTYFHALESVFIMIVVQVTAIAIPTTIFILGAVTTIVLVNRCFRRRMELAEARSRHVSEEELRAAERETVLHNIPAETVHPSGSSPPANEREIPEINASSRGECGQRCYEKEDSQEEHQPMIGVPSTSII